MRFIVICFVFFTSSVFANHFSVKDGIHRFTLNISKTELHYSSELLKKDTMVKDCNRDLTLKLNSDLLQLLRKTGAPVEGVFYLDHVKILIPKTGALAEALQNMDLRMMTFFQQEKQNCKE